MVSGRSAKWADLATAAGQFSCPPAGRFVTVYGQDLTAADIGEVTVSLSGYNSPRVGTSRKP